MKPLRLIASALALLVAAPSSASATLAVHEAYYRPDAVEYSWKLGDIQSAGSLHLYLKNVSSSPVKIEEVKLFGTTVRRLVAEPLPMMNRKVYWFRIVPNPVAPGEVANVLIRLAREPVLREVDDILGPLESAPVEAGAAADRLMELRDRLQNETNMAMHMPASPEGDDDTPLGRAMRDAIRDLKDAAGDAGKIERIAGRLRRLFERWRGIVTYETLE